MRGPTRCFMGRNIVNIHWKPVFSKFRRKMCPKYWKQRWRGYPAITAFPPAPFKAFGTFWARGVLALSASLAVITPYRSLVTYRAWPPRLSEAWGQSSHILWVDSKWERFCFRPRPPLLGFLSVKPAQSLKVFFRFSLEFEREECCMMWNMVNIGETPLLGRVLDLRRVYNQTYIHNYCIKTLHFFFNP